MEQEEQRKQYKRGMRNGLLIGIGAMLTVALLSLGVIVSFILQRLGAGATQDFKIGDDIVNKANSLIYYIDKYYLYEYDEEEMENAIYDAVMGSLGDPYAAYYTAEEYEELMESSEGTYYGIGVVVQLDEVTGYVKVVQPYENAPGAEAGIKPGDLITAVEGKDICNADLDLVVKDIKVEEGTYVTLTINRNGEVFALEVERRKVEIITVAYEMLEDNVGYIQISQFDVITVKQVEQAIKELESQGMKSLIMDVRNIPSEF